MMVRLAERLAELGETKLALELTAEAGELAKHKDVRSFHHHEASVLAAAGRAYLAQGEKDRGWEFLRRAIQAAEGPEGDDASDTLSGTAERLGKAGRFDEAFQLARAIEQPDSRAEAFREIGHLCVQAGRYEQALEAAREVRKPAARLALLAAIGKRYPGKGAEVSARARALLDELVR
jgi:tetratricopeptide (TPR) repeat protein